MKNEINYYYNLYPETIFQAKDEYYFFINNSRFSLIKYLGDLNEINDIYNRHLEMLNNNIYIHPIILNKDRTPLTIINREPYILLQTIYYDSKVTLKALIPFMSLEVQAKKRPNWGKLWSEKNDYLEYQISMLGQKHPLIRDSFSYYIGLGENAIELANMLENVPIKTVYAHKRISKKDTTYDLYNPLNITIDSKVRDISEYLKQNFFKGNNITTELEFFLTDKSISPEEHILFFARMLYPTYYFDIYEEIITNRKEDSEIIDIIKKTKEYENILKKIYNYYKRTINIIQIEWLEKK